MHRHLPVRALSIAILVAIYGSASAGTPLAQRVAIVTR